MALCEKILIAGFSGSGKSSLLKALAESSSPPWIRFDDLDKLIQKEHGFPNQTLDQLIHAESWEKFRHWEGGQLEKWLLGPASGVLALGGGTLNPVLIERLLSIGPNKLLYVQADFEVCWERLQQDQANNPRPLAQEGKEKFWQLYQDRIGTYERIPWRIENPPGADLKTLAIKVWSEVSRA